MSTTKPIPQQFASADTGLRFDDFKFMRDAVLNLNSLQATYGIVAAGTNQATATPLASVLNQVDTVTAGTGVNLPLSTGPHTSPCQICIVFNNGASALQIYGFQGSTDTINAFSASVGVQLPAGASAIFQSVKGGTWSTSDVGAAGSFSGNVTETLVGSGFVQKASSTGAGRAGTFTLNGATTVTVTNTTVVNTDIISISMNTPAGTVGAQPIVRFIQAGTAFAVLGTASDTSLYNYSIIGVN
jgi:hypothetical protein